jgi:hypothetical protein
MIPAQVADAPPNVSSSGVMYLRNSLGLRRTKVGTLNVVRGLLKWRRVIWIGLQSHSRDNLENCPAAMDLICDRNQFYFAGRNTPTW